MQRTITYITDLFSVSNCCLPVCEGVSGTGWVAMLCPSTSDNSLSRITVAHIRCLPLITPSILCSIDFCTDHIRKDKFSFGLESNPRLHFFKSASSCYNYPFPTRGYLISIQGADYVSFSNSPLLPRTRSGTTYLCTTSSSGCRTRERGSRAGG